VSEQVEERNERNQKGRWQKGQTGNPNGRPPKARETARLKTLAEVVTQDEWRRICEVALKDATDEGDYQAREKGRRFIADYLIGKPRQTVSIQRDGGDGSSALDDLTDEELEAIAGGAYPDVVASNDASDDAGDDAGDRAGDSDAQSADTGGSEDGDSEEEEGGE